MYYVTPYIATTKRLPAIRILQSDDGKKDDNSDDESQYVSTLPEERKDDIMTDDSSKKISNANSNLDSDSNHINFLVKHVIRSGRKTGLQFGWLGPSTRDTLQPTAITMAAIQNHSDQLQ